MPKQRSVESDASLVLPSGLSAQAAIDLVQRDLELPAIWTSVDDNAPDGYRTESGFAPQTGVHLQIQVTDVERLEFVPDDSSQDGPYEGLYYGPLDYYSAAVQTACDGLDLKASVALSADDGSISGTFDNAIVHVYSATDAVLVANADIREFVGSVQLRARPGDSLAGEFEILFRGDRLRGRLAPTITLSPGSVQSDTFTPIELRWPGTDTCSWYTFPYTEDEARELAVPTLANFGANNVFTAVYYDPTYGAAITVDDVRTGQDTGVLGEAQMTLETASPDAVCQGKFSYERTPLEYQSFELPAHFVSSDGR